MYLENHEVPEVDAQQQHRLPASLAVASSGVLIPIFGLTQRPQADTHLPQANFHRDAWLSRLLLKFQL